MSYRGREASSRSSEAAAVVCASLGRTTPPPSWRAGQRLTIAAVHNVHTVPTASAVSGGHPVPPRSVSAGSVLQEPACYLAPPVLLCCQDCRLKRFAWGRVGCGSTAAGNRPQESQEPPLRGRAYARSLFRSAQQAVACRASRAPGPDGPLAPLPARAVSGGESRAPRKTHPSARISPRRGLPAASYAPAAVLTHPATPP